MPNKSREQKKEQDGLKSKDIFLSGQFNIKTQRTARCFSLGTLNEQTKKVWIVLHGYGFHAAFIKKVLAAK